MMSLDVGLNILEEITPLALHSRAHDLEHQVKLVE
jgi:hypothetical protein